MTDSLRHDLPPDSADLNHHDNWSTVRVSTSSSRGKAKHISPEEFREIIDKLTDQIWIRTHNRLQSLAIIEFHIKADKREKIEWLKARGLHVEYNPFRHH
jgi:hypothetical protein